MTDPRERELEAALQRDWNDDTAAVYADLLTSRGDPHGELIAIDLALAKGITDELLERKRELVAAWLSTDKIAEQPWRLSSFKFGLSHGLCASTTVRHEIGDYIAMIFEAVGDRVRDVWLQGSNEDLTKGILALAARALPWLRELTLHRSDGDRPIDNEVWAALVEATPNLRTLNLAGNGVVLSPIHPAVRTLRVEGPAIAIGSEAVAGVTRLEIAFGRERFRSPPESDMARLASLVNPRAFPALRELDLSRNEPSKWEPPKRSRALAFLEAVENLDRFERVRVPSLPDVEMARELVALLERCPRLSIAVARMYTTLEITHPRLAVPAPRAWPASAHGRDALDVDVAGVPCDELALSSLIDDLEATFDDMRPDEQRAWLAFWTFLEDLPWEDDRGNTVYKTLPAQTLLTALEALDGANGRAENVAAAIRSAKLPADAPITISRYWGW